MHLFKLIPKDERRALKRIARSFFVLIFIFTILLYFAHDKPKCKPAPNKKVCQTKEK